MVTSLLAFSRLSLWFMGRSIRVLVNEVDNILVFIDFTFLVNEWFIPTSDQTCSDTWFWAFSFVLNPFFFWSPVDIFPLVIFPFPPWSFSRIKPLFRSTSVFSPPRTWSSSIAIFDSFSNNLASFYVFSERRMVFIQNNFQFFRHMLIYSQKYLFLVGIGLFIGLFCYVTLAPVEPFQILNFAHIF